MAESQTGSNNIPSDEKYPKLSKAASGYLGLEQFKNADLHTGYFCYDCSILSKILIVQ